jgi:hypothetical protein
VCCALILDLLNNIPAHIRAYAFAFDLLGKIAVCFNYHQHLKYIVSLCRLLTVDISAACPIPILVPIHAKQSLICDFSRGSTTEKFKAKYNGFINSKPPTGFPGITVNSAPLWSCSTRVFTFWKRWKGIDAIISSANCFACVFSSWQTFFSSSSFEQQLMICKIIRRVLRYVFQTAAT